MERILVSSCLLGEAVRYDGGRFAMSALLLRWQSEGRLLSFCPEVAGGLPVPRRPAEVPGGQGAEVLAGLIPVLTVDGEEVTGAFLRGAARACQLAAEQGIRFALLKARSPSCGNRQTYDGRFAGQLVDGEGVTAAALRQAGVQVFNETELEQLAALLDQPRAG